VNLYGKRPNIYAAITKCSNLFLKKDEEEEEAKCSDTL
jgi:hypothetical protein